MNITDDTAGGLSTLHCWSLIIFPSVCQPGGGECEQCPGCPVTLQISRDPRSDSRVLLQWSTAAVGYKLLATNELPNGSTGWAPIGPTPVVVNGKFTVTKDINGTSRYYRFRSP